MNKGSFWNPFFHKARRGRLFSRGTTYPVIISQTRLHSAGLLFEVTNPVEEWRVRELDHESEFLETLLHGLTEKDIFFDIGACVGLYAIHAALRCKQVCAFEPDPGFQERIQRNCTLNGIRNVRVLPWAVSDRSGRTNLYSGGIAGRSPSLRDFGQGPPLSVETRSLDEEIQQGRLPSPTIIKMDIEGAEFFALRGMSALFSSPCRPHSLFVEIHPSFLKHFDASAEDVLGFMHWARYREVYHASRDEQEHYIFKRA
jgi:FkbM family methyltransferase